MRDADRKVADPGRLLCRPFVFAYLASLLLFSQGEAAAGNILIFGQAVPGDPVSFTTDASGTTTITATDVPVVITTLGDVSVSPIPALFSLSATSTSTAKVVSSTDISEYFDGSFSFTAGGVNFLSGTWTEGLFDGIQGGYSGAIIVSDPLSSLTFQSDVISADLFDAQRAFALPFAGFTQPLMATNGGSLGPPSFHVPVNGIFSAAAPEPAGLVLMSIATPVVFCCGWLRRTRGRTSGRS